MPAADAMPIGEAARWACILEVCAVKAGNVHPGAGFADVTWRDFVKSGEAIAPILDDAARRCVGRTILDCVTATQHAVGRNTNLGIILLFAPLAAVPRGEPLDTGIERVLTGLTVEDAGLAFEAIRLANPGGLGDAGREDVRSKPTVTLFEAMRLAAGRDAVARQYSCGFADVLGPIATDLSAPGISALPFEQRIVKAHLLQMARDPDTLIARKCGEAVAQESTRLAQSVVDLDWPATVHARAHFMVLDGWLRGDGNRRNPGTSADLIAAGLLVALRRGLIGPPFEWVERLLR